MPESINARFKQLRRYLGLSQSEIGEKLGLKQGAVSKMEQNRNTITEASLKLLETAFNVNIEWLKTGKGKMFNDSVEDELNRVADKLQLSEIQKKAFLAFMNMPDNQRDIIAKSFWIIYNTGRMENTSNNIIKFPKF